MWTLEWDVHILVLARVSIRLQKFSFAGNTLNDDAVSIWHLAPGANEDNKMRCFLPLTSISSFRASVGLIKWARELKLVTGRTACDPSPAK